MKRKTTNTNKNMLTKVYLGMFDGTIAGSWFKWAEWFLVTAAL